MGRAHKPRSEYGATSMAATGYDQDAPHRNAGRRDVGSSVFRRCDSHTCKGLERNHGEAPPGTVQQQVGGHTRRP